MSHSPRTAPPLAWLLACALSLAAGPGSGAEAPAAPESKRPIGAFELVLQADLILEGVIADAEWPDPERGLAEAGAPLLELEVGQVLFGFVPGGGDRLRVIGLDRAAGEHRYAPYERGQRAVFFLRRPELPAGARASRDPWTQLGHRDEGEWPLIRYPDGSVQVLLRGTGLEPLAQLAPVSTRAFGHHYYGFRRPLSELRELVRVLRHCFEWRPRSALGGPRFDADDLRLTCSEAELAELVATSPLAGAVLAGSKARNADHGTAGS